MNVIKAEKKDLPEIVAIQKLAFYDVACFYNDFRLKPLLTTISELEKSFDSYTYYKIEDNGRIIASVRAKVLNSACHIENLIVHPKYQNRGIAKILLKRVENDNKFCDYLELFTGKEAPKIVSLYKRLGFEITEEKSATEKQPILVIMRKKIV